MSASLPQVLEYQNSTLLDYFCFKNPQFTLASAKLLFKDLLAWIWLNHKRANSNKKTYLFGPLLSLDELWHTFILHTHSYVEFCERYFGQYIHHEIEPVGKEYSLNEHDLEDFLRDSLDYLGEDWVKRRFAMSY